LKKVLLAVLGILLLLGIAGYLMRTTITLRLMERVIASNMQTNLVAELPDGLHVALCGAGSPLPDPMRSGPCTAVIAGGRIFIVDSGSGSSRVLSRMRIPQGEIEGILLTHFHSDHIDGLGELLLQRWAGGANSQPVPVHGPEGVAEVVDGINAAYAQSRSYRVAHHGEDVVPSSGAGGVARTFLQPAEGDAVVLIADRGLIVTAFRVDHEPVDPAVGYRFDYAGRSVVISGDTVKSANLQRIAKDADLLVHEALARPLVRRLHEGAAAAGRENLARITHDIQDYHTSPLEAAEVARDAGVGFLLYNHIVPPLLLPPMEDLFLYGVGETYDGPVAIGRDGTLIRMEPDSDSIELVELL